MIVDCTLTCFSLQLFKINIWDGSQQISVHVKEQSSTAPHMGKAHYCQNEVLATQISIPLHDNKYNNNKVQYLYFYFNNSITITAIAFIKYHTKQQAVINFKGYLIKGCVKTSQMCSILTLGADQIWKNHRETSFRPDRGRNWAFR